MFPSSSSNRRNDCAALGLADGVLGKLLAIAALVVLNGFFVRPSLRSSKFVPAISRPWPPAAASELVYLRAMKDNLNAYFLRVRSANHGQPRPGGWENLSSANASAVFRFGRNRISAVIKSISFALAFRRSRFCTSWWANKHQDSRDPQAMPSALFVSAPLRWFT